MEIATLTKLHREDLEDWGHNGYSSKEVYNINTVDTDDTMSFEFTKADKNFVKVWETSPKDISGFNEIIKQGHSFGAFENNKLIGLAICEARDWNNTLYIENLLVSEKYRRQHVGENLIQAVISHHAKNGFRLIELETQNTNVPAINFYKKQGFTITGMNLKLYIDSPGEFAFYMSYEKFN